MLKSTTMPAMTPPAIVPAFDFPPVAEGGVGVGFEGVVGVSSKAL